MRHKFNSYHIFHIFPSSKTNEIVLKIDDLMRQGPTPETCLDRIVFVGMGPKGDNAQFLQEAERNAAYHGGQHDYASNLQKCLKQIREPKKHMNPL